MPVLKFLIIQATLVLVQEAAILAVFLGMILVLRVCERICVHVQIFSLLWASALTVSHCL